jgi:hypothetical protein
MIANEDRMALLYKLEEIVPGISHGDCMSIVSSVFEDTRRLSVEFPYWWKGLDLKEHPAIQKTGGLGEAIRIGYHVYGWTEVSSTLVTKEQMMLLWYEVIAIVFRNAQRLRGQCTPELVATR